MAILYPITSRLTHWWRAQTLYSVHSPFLYEYINFVLDSNRTYYDFIALHRYKQSLLKPPAQFDQDSLKLQRKIKRKKLSENIHNVVFRHIVYAQTHRALEYGSDYGFLSLYIKKAGVRFLSVIHPDEEVRNYSHRIINQASESVIFFPSLSAVSQRSKAHPLDLIVIYEDRLKDLSKSEMHNLTTMAREDCTWIVLSPNASSHHNSQWLKLVELLSPSLTVDFYNYGIIWPGYPGEGQYIHYMRQHYLKPLHYFQSI